MRILSGIDITNINRKEFKNNSLIKRFLTEQEYNEFLSLSKTIKDKFIATHWAIKEAIFKAMQGEIIFKDINIVKVNHIYTCSYQDINFNISTSYEEPYIIANVFALIE